MGRLSGIQADGRELYEFINIDFVDHCGLFGFALAGFGEHERKEFYLCRLYFICYNALIRNRSFEKGISQDNLLRTKRFWNRCDGREYKQATAKAYFF